MTNTLEKITLIGGALVGVALLTSVIFGKMDKKEHAAKATAAAAGCYVVAAAAYGVNKFIELYERNS